MTPQSNAPAPELRLTADGSPTLYVPALDEHYHSRHGARQESQHVFIEAGLRPLLAAGLGQEQAQQPLRILEVGLGTGLNALLTLAAIRAANAPGATADYDVIYDGYETYPLPPEAVAALRPQWQSQPELSAAFTTLHEAPWDSIIEFAGTLYLSKLNEPIQSAELSADFYDLIYFDAFAPEKQPELWTPEVFAKLYAAAAPGAVLVSYCAQGQFRRNLRAAGWHTEKLPGPPGKREMTRARKGEDGEIARW